MKKIFFLASAIIALSSCSNNGDEAVIEQPEAVKLVDAKIGVNMCDGSGTRSYLGTVDSEGGTYYIEHVFESTDKFLVCDYTGQYPFTVCDGPGQSTSITGQWAALSDNAVRNGICVMIPQGSTRNGTSGTAVDVTNDEPTMHFTINTTQKSRTVQRNQTTEISYQADCGLCFACNVKKAQSLNFFPVVSFIYFYSKYPNCVIYSSDKIAGNYDVTYTGKASTGSNADGTSYTSVDGIDKYLTYEAEGTTINCEGVVISGHSNAFSEKGLGSEYEYVIAVKPGTYSASSFRIFPNTTTLPSDPASATAFHNKNEVKLCPGFVYFMGSIDNN